jgi:hypothetical protein
VRRHAERAHITLAFIFFLAEKNRGHRSASNNQLISAEYCGQSRIVEERLDLLFDPHGETNVIRVLNCVIFSSHLVQGTIKRNWLGCVSLPKNPNSIVRQQILDCIDAAISTTVVNDYNIQVSVSLSENAFQRRTQVFPGVVNAHDNTNKRPSRGVTCYFMMFTLL